MKNTGLEPTKADRRDYSFLHTYGATVDPKGLPANFSIYDGREIPDQNDYDNRFTPAIPPLPMGCTGESQTFLAGLQDSLLYPPDDLYNNTPPRVPGQGRSLRESLTTTIKRGFKLPNGDLGNRRVAYFNCYGAGAIDDTDAARMALWINQVEKRGVTVGSYWYSEFSNPSKKGILPAPSYDTKQASLHNWIITGWKTVSGTLYLEIIPWCGKDYGDNGRAYMSRPIFNGLMAQPYTGAFTITKLKGNEPVPIGIQAIVDHFVYWFRNLTGL